ncbi:lytic transglycosylase domain-containing protein [Synechococcus sp. M16CYN]
MRTSPQIGIFLLLGIATLSGLATWGGQRLLVHQHEPLTPDQSISRLWRIYRWSIDPQQRREAALLIASQSGSIEVLRSQAWGTHLISAVVLEQAAETATIRGETRRATLLWQDLLRRFPNSASSASARQVLGEQDSELHMQLLDQQPSHPAALSVAARMDPSPDVGYLGAVHLARWGARWPGAFERMSHACNDNSSMAPNAQARQLLARGLASLGDGQGALRCLQNHSLNQITHSLNQPSTQLAIGRALLQGGFTKKGTEVLLALSREHSSHPASDDAARLLSEPLRPDPQILDALPTLVQERSAAVAAARVRLAGGDDADSVLKRWPNDPDVWQLQWDLARDALLLENWNDVRAILSRRPNAKPLPDPLEARRLYWLGLSTSRLGDRESSRRTWQKLITQFPAGYYRWLAQYRLGHTKSLSFQRSQNSMQPLPWRPLNSVHPFVNTLWRLGLKQKAWQTWRTGIDPAIAQSKPERLVEGRLRLAIGDSWMGLDQLWRLNLRWRSPTCRQRIDLRQSQYPLLFKKEFAKAAKSEQLPLELLLAISKQESGFASGVTSPAGAIGLMQLMPATAIELAGAQLSEKQIREPELNIKLGAAYLNQLLERWGGDPLRSIASYNAGPEVVGSWSNQLLQEAPDLWVERIPYPETRFYAKKIIDNMLAYLERNKNFCKPILHKIEQKAIQRNLK